MSITPAQLIAPQQLTNAAATYYTSTSLTTRIDKLSVTNTTGGAVTVTIYLITVGGSASAANTITYQKSINAGQTWNCPDVVGQVLKNGDFIQALASANASLTIMASGVQIT